MSLFYLHLLLFYFCSCSLCKQQHITLYAKIINNNVNKKKAKEKLTVQEWGKLMIFINKFICFLVFICCRMSHQHHSFILDMYSQNARSHVWCVYLCCIMGKSIENICNIITEIIIRTTEYEAKHVIKIDR